MKPTAMVVGLPLFLVVLVTGAGASYWTGREAVRALRRWKAGLREPLISPDPGVVDRLDRHWPVDPNRWPQPFSDGDRRLGPELCAAYAYEAWRKVGRIRAASEVSLIVGGAWLGTTLPTTYGALLGNPHGLAFGFVPLVYLDGKWWAGVAPWVLIALGVALRGQAEGVELVQMVYTDAAEHDASMETPMDKDRGMPSVSFWAWVRTLRHRR